jgi:glycosyltransferase involved in cell wall biosynthesis
MHSNRILLSILIPTRNRAHYVHYAIQSTLNIPSPDVEIIVSENHGSDDGWQVANSFSDPRLKVVRPDKPLPMHQNWEFLLSKARGRWITFIGDDDAVMPHCADYLSYLDSQYPEAEAIVSPRAYYFWGQAYNPDDKPKCVFSLAHFEAWQDSKNALRLCLDDQKEYIYLPQIYSGGFQRRSLVQRVIRLQGGHYFRSVTPDAYSAVVATLHTYRYLEVGMPMTWIGTSPSSKVVSSAKDRTKDFYGMHSDDFIMNPVLGDEHDKWPFLIHFFEAYVAAAPFTDLSELSFDRIRSIYRLAATRLILSGNLEASTDLALSLGVEPVDPELVIKLERRFKRPYNKIHRIFSKMRGLIRRRLNARYKNGNGDPSPFSFSHESSGDECPTILSADSVLISTFSKYASLHLVERSP